jgi:hypothetical protein
VAFRAGGFDGNGNASWDFGEVGTTTAVSVVGFGGAGGPVDLGFGEARAKDSRVGAGVLLPAMIEVLRASSLCKIRRLMHESSVPGTRRMV